MKLGNILLVCLFIWANTTSIDAFTTLNNTTFSGEMQPGYIIPLDEDTIYGHIELPSLAMTQLKVRFYDENRKKTIYTVLELDGYGFCIPIEKNETYHSQWFHFVRKEVKDAPIASNEGEILVQHQVAGPANLYSLYVQGGLKLGKVKRYYYLEKTDHHGFFQVTAENFKEITASFFKDYPKLSSKIGTANYKFDDMVNIVRKYNAWKYGTNMNPSSEMHLDVYYDLYDPKEK